MPPSDSQHSKRSETVNIPPSVKSILFIHDMIIQCLTDYILVQSNIPHKYTIKSAKWSAHNLVHIHGKHRMPEFITKAVLPFKMGPDLSGGYYHE